MKIETPEHSTRFINQAFISKIENGQLKEAADAGTAFIRDRMREESFARKVLPPKLYGPGQLDKSLNAGNPRIVFDKEPDSKAMSMNFRGTGDHTYFDSERFELAFYKIESQRFNKNKFELLDYDFDIRDVLTKNSVKDMSDQEDKYFINGCLDMAISETASYSLSTPEAVHYMHMPNDGKITTESIRKATSMAFSKRVPVGTFLCSSNTFETLNDIPHSSIGAPAASQYESGVSGRSGILGHNFIKTIKSDIIPDGVVYMFSSPEYFGVYGMLQDATMFMKTEADMIQFWSYSSVGCSIANHKGIGVLDLRDTVNKVNSSGTASTATSISTATDAQDALRGLKSAI